MVTASQSVSDPQGPNLTAIIPSSVVAAIIVLLLILVSLVASTVCVKRSTAKVVLQVSGNNIELGDQPTIASNLKRGSTVPEIKFVLVLYKYMLFMML